MNFLDIKPGEHFEVGTQKAYRFWRYVFRPERMCHDHPCKRCTPANCCQSVRLLSWVSDTRWHPRQFVEGTTPDEGEQGIHGFKTIEDMLQSFENKYESLLIRSLASGCDGVILGEVALWGIIWDHTHGYRAQFGRPIDFIVSYGNRSEQALAELRAQWGFK